jgi:hypothetical protein
MERRRHLGRTFGLAGQPEDTLAGLLHAGDVWQSMFIAATAMHVIALALLLRPEVKGHFLEAIGSTQAGAAG